jgi:succinate dehydrogenase flavin-adding protein (antitoxin of CptAB toxin-antitoxin module)
MTPVQAKQLIGRYLVLDTTRGPFDQDEFDSIQKEKRGIVRQLLTSNDEQLLRIALTLQLDRHAQNCAQAIRLWLEHS